MKLTEYVKDRSEVQFGIWIQSGYDKETGPEHGSWKGGTTGYTTLMLKGESLEEAFYRLSHRDGFSDIKFVR